MGRKPGLPRIYLADGSDVYQYSFTVPGREGAKGERRRGSTGARGAREAEEAAQRIYAEACLGRRPTSRRRVSYAASTSLEMLSAEFTTACRADGKADSYVDKIESHFRAHFLPRWSRVVDITGPAVAAYKLERTREPGRTAGKVGPVTVYKELVSLSRFLRWAKKQGHITEIPDFERVRPISDYKPPDLTPDDVAEILPELPDRRSHPKRCMVREFFTVEWSQGFRPGEAGTLLWEDVDLVRGTAGVRMSKDKARVGRVIALGRDARSVLEALAAERDVLRGPVLRHAGKGRAPDYRTSLRKAIEAVNVKRAKVRRPALPHITPHHFRHARISELASSTRDVAAVQFFAGHKNLSTTDRYVRSRTERTTMMLEALEAADSVRAAAKSLTQSKPPKSKRR